MTGPATYRLSRRRLIALLAGTAALAAADVVQAAPEVTPISEAGTLRFDIVRSGAVIGTHEVTFATEGEQLVARTRIRIKVSLLWVTLFDYAHQSVETWQNGRLVAYRSTTLDNGRRDTVVGDARGDGFEVTGRKGTALAPADVMAASFWNPDIIHRTLLIDPQKGTLKRQVIHGHDRVTMMVGGVPRQVTRYRVSSVMNGDLYYDDDGHWIGGTFDKKDSQIVYRLHA